MNALLTDLYQLTMAAGYVQAGKTKDRATFEMFVRRMPYNRNFFLVAGLEQAVDYILNLRFNKDEIDYLRGLGQFKNAPAEFFETLAGFRFSGDVFAVPEGTPVFWCSSATPSGSAARNPLTTRSWRRRAMPP